MAADIELSGGLVTIDEIHPLFRFDFDTIWPRTPGSVHRHSHRADRLGNPRRHRIPPRNLEDPRDLARRRATHVAARGPARNVETSTALTIEYNRLVGVFRY